MATKPAGSGNRWWIGLAAAVSLATAGALTAPASGVTAEPELAVEVANPSFEEPSVDGNIPSWRQTFGPSGAFSIVSDASDGAQAVRMVDSDRSTSTGLQSATFAVDAGQTYEVSAAVRRTEGLPGVYLLFFDAAGTRIGSTEDFFPTPANAYTTVSVDGVAPAGATQAAVLLYSSGYQITTAVWDDVRVRAVPDTTWQEKIVGQPITNIAVLAGGFGTVAGQDLTYQVLSGTVGTLVVTDTASGEVLGRHELPGAEGSWGVTSTADGTAYVSGWPNGHLYRYVPGADAVEDLGQPVPGQSFLWKLDVGDDGRVYGGSYPGGAVFSYDPATGTTHNFGQVLAGSQYVRDVAAGDGVVYAGLGSVRARVVEIDTESGARREIPLPAPYDSEGTVYDVDLVGDLLFVRVEQTSTLLVHDLGTGEWVADLGKVKGLQVSGPDRAGRVYFAAASNKLMSYNVESGKVADTGASVPGSTRGFGWATLGTQKFPDRTLVMSTYAGGVWAFNPWTGATTTIKPQFDGLPVPLRSLAEGPDGRIYTSGYQSGGLAAYDAATGDVERFPSGTVGQVEGSATANGKLYLGVYPGANLYSFDPASTFDFGTNPKKIASLTAQGQDRAVAWATDGETVAAGYIATYGKLNGSVSIIDPATDEVRSFHDVVPNQSVASLEIVDGLVLGGTTVYGGLGATPTEDEAELFLLDPATGEVIWRDVPIAGERAITALRQAPDGTVWGVTAGMLFQFDVDSRQVVRSQLISPMDWSSVGHVWTSGELAFASDGTMYALVRGDLFRVDTATMERQLIARGVEHFTLAADGQVYLIRDENLLTVSP